MIVRMAEVYTDVATINNIPVNIVESIGVEVLSTLREKLNSPDEIGYELPKLGTFSLKHNRYESFHRFLINAVETGKYKLGVDYPEAMYGKNIILMEKIIQFRIDKENKNRLKNEAKANKTS